MLVPNFVLNVCTIHHLSLYTCCKTYMHTQLLMWKYSTNEPYASPFKDRPRCYTVTHCPGRILDLPPASHQPFRCHLIFPKRGFREKMSYSNHSSSIGLLSEPGCTMMRQIIWPTATLVSCTAFRQNKTRASNADPFIREIFQCLKLS